jgi:hypothetical protein
MKSMFTAALAAALFTAGPASSAIATLDFDGPTSFASISEYYNGGTDTAGASGSDLGVSFGLDAMALQNDEAGPYFSNAPSPLGILAVIGAEATMNVVAGFTGDVALSYSSNTAVEVRVWSGLDGTGSVLGTFQLANNRGACAEFELCNWSPLAITLGAGAVARSITFGDAATVAGFDNVTITAVPEPESVVLLALGLAGLGVAVARKKQQVFRA